MTQEIVAEIGECVYCGAKENLANEHIVPLALGGNLVLQNASCRSCAKITGKFEQRVLRGFMMDARTAAVGSEHGSEAIPSQTRMWHTTSLPIDRAACANSRLSEETMVR